MTEAIPLSELRSALLDEATLGALVDDITRETEVLGVQVKGAPEALSEGGGALAEAVVMLREGRVRAVQVRYRHRGVVWTDTLLRGPEGVRLVRVAMP